MHDSATTNGFYPSELKDDYESAGSWPVDAIEISQDDYQALINVQAKSKEITPDANDKQVLTDPAVDPVVTAEGTKRQFLKEAEARVSR